MTHQIDHHLPQQLEKDPTISVRVVYLTQQPPDLREQPPPVLAPPRTVALELVDDGEERLVLLDGEVGDALGRRGRREDDLVEHLVHALADDCFVRPAVGCLAHDLLKRCVLIYKKRVPNAGGTLTLNRCCVRIFSTSRTSGMRNLTPTCGIVSRFTKFFFRRT